MSIFDDGDDNVFGLLTTEKGLVFADLENGDLTNVIGGGISSSCII